MKKVKIKNVVFQHTPSVLIGSVRKPSGTLVQVHLSKKRIVELQLETNQRNETIFFHPAWKFADKDLISLVQKIVEWEEEYEDYMKQEKSLWEHHIDDDPDEDISIPSWL